MRIIKISILLSFMTAIGCSEKLQKSELNWGIEQCSNNGGINTVKVPSIVYPSFKCENGAVFQMLSKHVNTNKE